MSDRDIAPSQSRKRTSKRLIASVSDTILNARALIFDVDGTIAETEEVHRRAFNETFSYFHLRWDWDAALYRELLLVTGGKERIRYFADSPKGGSYDLSEEEIARMHRFKTERYVQLIASSQCALRPGVSHLMKVARDRGQRLAIATTTSRKNVEALLASTLGPPGVKLFEVVIAGDEVPRKKPAPDVYLKALQELDLAGSDCIAIEDSRNGLMSALGAAIPVVITPSMYSSSDDFTGSLAVLKSLEDLPFG